MELPDLGRHCDHASCKQLDFLPIKCDACAKTFCKDHMFYAQHDCEAAYNKDVQVPVCPLCNRPVPVRRGEPPDIKVSEHIDTDCQSDPAKQKRTRIYTNKCSLRGCKQKEMVNITCRACDRSFCLKHRHPQDHNCDSANNNTKSMSKAGAAALSRMRTNGDAPLASTTTTTTTTTTMITDWTAIQGNISEDEALARALQVSLADNTLQPSLGLSREEQDRRLAESLAANETRNRRAAPRRTQLDGCHIT